LWELLAAPRLEAKQYASKPFLEAATF
jgi:hypothetical protein